MGRALPFREAKKEQFLIREKKSRMDSGDEQDAMDSKGKKKRYHRHTPRQIQELEAYI